MPTMDAPAFPSQNNRALLHPATSDACPVKHRHAPTRFASPLPVGRGRRGHDTEKFLNSLAPRRVGACCRRNARRHPPLSPWPSLRGEKGTETGASVGPELFGCFRGYVLRAETATGQAWLPAELDVEAAKDSAFLGQARCAVAAALPDVDGLDAQRLRARTAAIFPCAAWQAHLRADVGHAHGAGDRSVAITRMGHDIAALQTVVADAAFEDAASFSWGDRRGYRRNGKQGGTNERALHHDLMVSR